MQQQRDGNDGGSDGAHSQPNKQSLDRHGDQSKAALLSVLNFCINAL